LEPSAIVAFERRLDIGVQKQRLAITMQSIEAQQWSENAERLSWEEICKRFPDEWVVLVDVDWENDTDFTFGGAMVIGHHKRRKDASPDVKAAFEHHDEVGTFWTGKIRGPIPRFFLP
jgi:hypothetical protein